MSLAPLEAQTVTNLPAMWETWVQSLGREDPLEKRMATQSSTVAWRSPWTEEPGGLWSMGSQRVNTTERLTLSLIFTHVSWFGLPGARVVFISSIQHTQYTRTNSTRACLIDEEFSQKKQQPCHRRPKYDEKFQTRKINPGLC